MLRGGQRQHSGRRPRDTIVIRFSVPRPIYDELVGREKQTGIYRSRLASELLIEGLMNDSIERELGNAPRART
jgi:hypothetical protein